MSVYTYILRFASLYIKIKRTWTKKLNIYGGSEKGEKGLCFWCLLFPCVSIRICTFAIKGKAKRLKEVDITSTMEQKEMGSLSLLQSPDVSNSNHKSISQSHPRKSSSLELEVYTNPALLKTNISVLFLTHCL